MTDPGPLRLFIDGANMAHRDFHAAGLDRIAGITRRRMQTFRDRWKPDRIMAAFDLPEPTFRHQLHSDYKAGRKPPAEINDAIEICQSALLDSCVDVVSSPGFEADDVIATLTRIALDQEFRVVVYSADKDLHQLITPGRVTQLVACRRDHGSLRCQWQTDDSLKTKFGVTADQWIDYRTMVGDSSDNLPGIRGIGPDVAEKVLQRWGSLDEFYAAPLQHRLHGSAHTKLINAKRKVVPWMRELLTLRDDTPLAGMGWST